MSLTKKVFAKRAAIFSGLAVLFAVVSCAVLAAGPTLKNINPQGTVTSSSVSITLDTLDLARCRYSTSDTSYTSMGNDMYTPDGLYHSGLIGTLNHGSYTYYVRCQDFEGNENSTSAVVSFTVGDIGCIGSNCPVVSPPVSSGTPPVLSGFSPTGTVTSKYVTLSVSTDKASSCRYSWYDKEYDAMTLALTSNNKLYHVASATLSNAGNYNYYVRCKDESGNVNSPAGKITFYYYVYTAPVKTTSVATTPADTAAPSISGLSPSGNVNTKEINLALDTDETATCRYGKSDVDYELMPDNFGSAGTSHSAKIVLDAPGEYTYYVRCIDSAKNKNTVSGQVNFNYSLPEGPKVSDLQPSGVIYQSTLALIATTDKASSCRFSENDLGYDQMGDFFDTSDGFLHQATVDLPDYGFYSYYVRCVDEDGVSGDKSEMISFEYQNPNPEAVSAETPEESAPITCEQIQIGARNGECDPTLDCVCDSDCPASGDDADPDCAGVEASSGGGNGWVALLFIGLILLIIIVIVIIIIKRRSSEEEDVELP